ncbi:hypothetical protein Hanom_Chr16g01471981 [Helianthus anomalus]
MRSIMFFVFVSVFPLPFFLIFTSSPHTIPIPVPILVSSFAATPLSVSITILWR